MKRILLVDDDPCLLDSSRRLFDGRLAIETAVGAEQGLAAIAQSGPFAVVVSDMRMPGIDGVQFLAEVRSRAPATVRMMLTGHPDLQTAINAVNRGAISRFLTKPCSPEALGQALEDGIAQYQFLQRHVEVVEAKLRHCQSMELAGQCAAGAVHDLRNILSVILLQSGLTIEQEPTHSRLAASMQRIHNAAANATDLTQQMLAVCRPRAEPCFRPVDVRKLLTDLCGMLRHILPRAITVQCDCPDGLDAVNGDAGMLTQVFLNLALNARDAMPRGGRLLMGAARFDLDADRGQHHPDAYPGRFARLQVIDTGCGMSPAVRQQLFQPFFTTKQEGEGTGLGLSVVAQIVRQHRGWIEVLSEPGQGSAFKVFLPAHRPDSTGEGKAVNL